MVIKGVRGGAHGYGSGQVFIDETISFSFLFDCVKFMFCFSESNQVTYRLVKWVVVNECSDV